MMYFFPEISTQRKVKQRKAKQRKEKPPKRKDFAADGETVERRSGETRLRRLRREDDDGKESARKPEGRRAGAVSTKLFTVMSGQVGGSCGERHFQPFCDLNISF